MKTIKFLIDEERIDRDVFEFLEQKGQGSPLGKAAYLLLREYMTLLEFLPHLAHNEPGKARKRPDLAQFGPAPSDGLEINFEALDDMP